MAKKLTLVTDVIGRNAKKPASFMRGFLNEEQINLGKREGLWMQRILYGRAMESSVAADRALRGQGISHFGNELPNQPVPDLVARVDKYRVNIELTGPSETSINKHLKRNYIDGREQILTYDSPSDDFLKGMFG
jgi:hypothetical protein